MPDAAHAAELREMKGFPDEGKLPPCGRVGEIV